MRRIRVLNAQYQSTIFACDEVSEQRDSGVSDIKRASRCWGESNSHAHAQVRSSRATA
jgi:hypothetical protein